MPQQTNIDPYARLATTDPYAHLARPVEPLPQQAPVATTRDQQPPKEGFLRSFADSSGLALLPRVLSHPIDSAATVLDAGKRLLAPGQPARMADNPNPLISGIGRMVDNTSQSLRQGLADYKSQGLTQQTRRELGRAIPVVGPALSKAQAQVDSGNAAGGVGTMLGLAGGLVGPELLKIAPEAAGSGLRGTGNALENAGTARMDTFLNGGRKLPLDQSGYPMYDNPGRAVLESGPTTSIATSRRAMLPKVSAARNDAGRAIDPAAMASPARVGTPALWDAVNRVVDPMITDATGPLGNTELAQKLEGMRESFMGDLGGQNYLSVPETLQLKRTLDRNISRSGGFDSATSNATNSAAQKIRAGVKNALYDAAPELHPPSQRYEDLSDASNLLEQNQGIRSVQPWSLRRGLLDLAIGGGVFGETRNPALSVAAGLTTHVLPMAWRAPLTQTGLATAEYGLGKGLNTVAPTIEGTAPGMAQAVNSLPSGSRLALPAAGSIIPRLGPPSQPSDTRSTNTQQNTDDREHATPPGVSSLTPMISPTQSFYGRSPLPTISSPRLLPTARKLLSDDAA